MTGGSAAERGLDYQARVSAIVMTHLLTDRPLAWLQEMLDDTPLELDAETGGPGDDIRFSVKGRKQVELQAKRGLHRGEDLWIALINLSKGISDGTVEAGILAVCPNSSGTIRETLAEDIVRIGTGRSDGLREIGQAWLAKLSELSMDATLVCARLRIVVVSAVDGNREAEATAEERLSRVVQNPGAAWSALVEYGRRLIRRRERARPENICRVLSLAHIALKTSEVDTRVQLSAAMCQWLHGTYASMPVLGVHSKIPFDECWLELDAQVMDSALPEQEDLDKALRYYHEYGRSRRNDGRSYHSRTIARFVKKCVVIGGPGMGKSTLLKRLALDYSNDGFLTLFVRLPLVVAFVRDGCRFEESLITVALSGSGLPVPPVSLEGGVILCDALDECGSQQPLLTEKLHAFSVAHPNTRVVVTSRPIGYRPGELAGWRHYELQPMKDDVAEKAVTKVLDAIPFPNPAQRSLAVEQAIAQLNTKTIKAAAARSPLMITLVAALSVKGVEPGLSKGGLYGKFFQLLQENPPSRLSEVLPSKPERNRFLEMLGWCLLSYGNEPAEDTLSRCVDWWREETGQSALGSETRISECLGYWEGLGVVERVRSHNQEAITFVHKTFGEFAAARYMSRCALESQRGIIKRAICTPDWKETLSFASHLGLTSLILQVWVELAEGDDSEVGNRLDEAVELVVQAGVPVDRDAMMSFTQCCWQAVENTASRARYAAGEALCLVSQEHWSQIRGAVLARLDSTDGWERLVAWACLCVSTDQELTITMLTDVLPKLAELRPANPYLGGFTLGPTGNAVWQQLVLGAARRILAKPPEPDTLRVFYELVDDFSDLNLGVFNELGRIFMQAGQELRVPSEHAWLGTLYEQIGDSGWWWKREMIYLLSLIDDPLMEGDEAESAASGRSLELGACMTAISYWDTPLEGLRSETASESADAARRLVIHALSRSAGIDHSQMVRQARAMKKAISENVKHAFALRDLPLPDAKIDLSHPLVDEQFMFALEDLIVGPSDLFASNAAYVLYSMNKSPEYLDVLRRILSRGRGESLRLSAELVKQLPDEIGQQLMLDRLCQGGSISGCSYLYSSLTAPYGPRHLEAVRKGLRGNSPEAAEAAAVLVKEFPLDGALAEELRVIFDEWRAKETPYPKQIGVIPNSPRDELAGVLAAAFAQNHDFLLTLLADERPGVRSAASDHFLVEAAGSATLRSKILEETLAGVLEPSILRKAVSNGLYLGAEAITVGRLLHSENARLRYAALPILDMKYLQLDQVRDECERLLSDKELEIRECASRLLRGLIACRN